MISLKMLGIFWTLFGAAGLCGIRKIPSKIKGYSWGKEYFRRANIGYLLLGVPYFVLFVVIPACFPNFNHNEISKILIIAPGLPSVIYSILNDRKYKALLKKAQDEGGEMDEK